MGGDVRYINQLEADVERGKCSLHPTYTGRKYPKNGCQVCTDIWHRRHPGQGTPPSVRQ